MTQRSLHLDQLAGREALVRKGSERGPVASGVSTSGVSFVPSRSELEARHGSGSRATFPGVSDLGGVRTSSLLPPRMLRRERERRDRRRVLPTGGAQARHRVGWITARPGSSSYRRIPRSPCRVGHTNEVPTRTPTVLGAVAGSRSAGEPVAVQGENTADPCRFPAATAPVGAFTL